MQVGFGIVASFLIGTSDYLGAKSSGRTTALQTTTVAFLGGAVATAIVSPFLGTPTVRDLAIGALSGLAAFAALTTLWFGYARSGVGAVAPVTAVVSTVLPVLWSMFRGDGPGAVGWVGVGVGVIALVLTSHVPGSRNLGDGVVLGVLAGTFFAAMFLLAVNTDEAAGTWPVVAQRTTAFAVAVCVGVARSNRPVSTDRVAVRWSLLAGGSGACGVAAIVLGGQRGPIAPVIVAGSMYPAVAVGLAWLFLRERSTRRQIVGILAALVGVALIAID
ncbi:MAG: EamA family transporter [Ilumatobacteraceae bacterium]